MRRIAMTVAILLATAMTVPILGWAQQPGDCRPAGAAPAGYLAVTVGHFSEGVDDLVEFCQYLLRQRIWPAFQSLGSVKDRGAARRAHDALEAGTIDVLWVNSYAAGALLEANRDIRLKVVAFTDFLVLHVGARQSGAEMVTDAGFAPTEVAVRAGRSMFFADVLFGILRRRPRCLEAAVGCTVLAGEGLAAQMDRFLGGGSGRAVVLASWALPPKGPDVVVRSLYAGEFHLVGVPPATVVSMQSVTGTLAILQIPRGAYGPAQRADISTAAVTQMVVSSTPPEVQARVRELGHRLNDALFDRDPRINIGGDMPTIVEMTQRLAMSVGSGRLIFSEELARQLESHGLLRHEPDRHEPDQDRGGGGY